MLILTMQYSKHAKFQMGERSITESEVNECLAEHSVCYTDKKGNQIIRSDNIRGRGIKVVIAKDDPNFIITVADY